MKEWKVYSYNAKRDATVPYTEEDLLGDFISLEYTNRAVLVWYVNKYGRLLFAEHWDVVLQQ